MTTPSPNQPEEWEKYKEKAALILTPLIKQIFHGENSTSEHIHKEIDAALVGFVTLLHTERQAARKEWLRSEIEKLEGMTRKCEYCGKVWDDDCRDYDGDINCTCEKGNYQYGHRWDEFGFNQALTTIITRYKEELDTL